MGGVASKIPQLIPKFRKMVDDLNVYRHQKGLAHMRWILENVASSGELMTAAMMTDGLQIGSRVNRKRMLECNWSPNCELSHNLRLCLGDRAKWPRTDDKFLDKCMRDSAGSGVAQGAKPEFHLAPPCCRGSSWSPVGSHTSHTGSRFKWAEAMGVDSNMSRKSILNGLHVLQGALMCGPMMRQLCCEFGAPMVTLQEARSMADPSLISMVRNWESKDIPSSKPEHGLRSGGADMPPRFVVPKPVPLKMCQDVTDQEAWNIPGFMVGPECVSEVHWSVHGDFTNHVCNSPSMNSPLDDLCGISCTDEWYPDLDIPCGHALVEVTLDSLSNVIPWMIDRVCGGAKMSVVTRDWEQEEWHSQLEAAGFTKSRVFDGVDITRVDVSGLMNTSEAYSQIVLWQKVP